MTETERILTQLWSEILEVEEVSIDEDFFHLGGTSLTAFALLIKIEQKFAHSPGFGNGTEAITIRRQAAFLDGDAGSEASGIRPLILKGNSSDPQLRSLFLVHGAAADELDCYFHLVRSLPDALKIYGLPSHGKLTGREFETVEEMAIEHVRAIRSVQPSGPYFLGGFSFGGLVAYEIAQQFQSMGETVEALVVFDYQMNSREPFHFPRAVSELKIFLSNCGLAVGDLITSGKNFKACIDEAIAWMNRTIVTHSGDGKQGAPNTGFWHCGELTPEQNERSSSQFRASLNYKSRSYSGPITLFRHRRLPILQPYDSSLGWKRLCPGGVDIRIVEGSTMNGFMLRAENAPKVAKELLSLFAPLNRQPGESTRSLAGIST